MDEIKVYVVKAKDRPNYRLRWVDPITNRMKTKSAGTTSKREARNQASELERELREGKTQAPERVKWAQFRDWYEDNCLSGMAAASAVKGKTIFDRFEKIINPQYLAKINTQQIQHFQTELRLQNLREETIAGYVAYLQAALNWAVDQGMLKAAPKITKPKRAKGSKRMKGRPISGEEFERMVEKVPEVVGEWIADDWRFLLRGLWWSGLRLNEALNLTWDNMRKPMVDLSGETPQILMPAEYDKANMNRTMIAAPEFAEMLLSVPEEKRRGYVFKPTPIRERGYDRLGPAQVCINIGKIGKAALVKVAEGTRLGKPYEKFASAHDLRRSFATRWSTEITAPELKEVMRHSSLETTMGYYIHHENNTISERMYAATSKRGNVEQKSTEKSSIEAISTDSATSQERATPVNTALTAIQKPR